MEKFLQRVDHRSRNDAAMLVEVVKHTDRTLKVRVLDFHGDINALVDAEHVVEEVGIADWMELAHTSTEDGRVTYHEKVIADESFLFKFVDYRTIDVQHVNKLMELRNTSVSYSRPKLDGHTPCHFLDGISVLPGNYVLATGYNKVWNGNHFDQAYGEQLLHTSLGNKSREKLNDLEGYRHFRNIKTLDSALDQAIHGLDLSYVPVCMANSVPYIEVASGFIYIVTPKTLLPAESPESARAILKPGTYFIPHVPHFAAKMIISSYIEPRN